jgi:hypothetical protein
MNMSESDIIAEFRRAVNRAVGESEQKWEDSRRLLEPAVFPSILGQLVQQSQAASMALQVKAALAKVLAQGQARRVQDLMAPLNSTGYPPSKAFLSLFYFSLYRAVTMAHRNFPVKVARAGDDQSVRSCCDACCRV